MHAAANTLALCLLALTSLPARCQHDQAKPLCEYPLRIRVESVHDDVRRTGLYKVSVAYGAEVDVWCTRTSMRTDAKKLTFLRNGKKILITHHATFGIMFKKKLDLQSSPYIFKCTDIDTTCEQSVNILVTPRFEVISPNFKTCFYNYRLVTYYVQYGKSVSVLCSGTDATRLAMTKDGKTVPTEHKNGTTIESFEMTPDLQISKYACSDVDTTHSTGMNIEVVPNIYFQSQNETITPYDMDFDCSLQIYYYYFQYSGSIEIFCSGPQTVKFIDPENENKNVSTKNYNETTVFTNITKLGISKYACADSEFSDYVQTVNVLVFNRMEVVSPSVRLVGIERGVPKYTILYSQPLEIVCSVPDASRLTISDELGDTDINITDIIVQAVNKSAIRYIRNNPEWRWFKTFICSELTYKPTKTQPTLLKRYESDLEQSRIEVAILPTVANFRCISYNLQFVNCTWTRTLPYLTVNNTLYNVADGILTQICYKPQISRLSKLCVWEYEDGYTYMLAKVLTFLIQSCSSVACYNQTFQFDHLSIVKLAPPEELTVLGTTSRGAWLKWSGGTTITGDYGAVDQKVQYWYPGIDPRDVNSSLVTCNGYDVCYIELNLLCPDQFYEVRIFHKLKKASEEFMSAPSSVTFYTDRESDDAINNDPTCSQESVKTKEVMRYLVQELKKEMRPKIEPMKRAVHALQEKLANVRKYIASIKEQDEK